MLRDRVQKLEARLERLELELAKAGRHSGNSSKPPSSDIIKGEDPGQKPGDSGPPKRKIGGQPGHPRQERKAFSAEEVDKIVSHGAPKVCPLHGTPLEERAGAAPEVVQQIVLPKKLYEVHEHRAFGGWCAACRKIHYAPLPKEVEAGGLAGAELTALCGYLKGGLSLSFSEMRSFFAEVFGLEFSTGYLTKLARRSGESAEAPFAELVAQLPLEEKLFIDETGHPEKGERWWTWVFRAATFSCFVIRKSRAGAVLEKVLGREFGGLIHCDYFGAYRKFGEECLVMTQFCLAHLIRDIRFLAESPDLIARDYGQGLLDRMRALFHLWHERKESGAEEIPPGLRLARMELLEFATSPPEGEEAHPLIANMAKRFRENGDGYFLFLSLPGVEPTNNLAEQALRFVVMARRKTQGTRGERGRSFCERLWSLKTTCRMRGRSLYAFLRESAQAYLTGAPAPTLLPST